MAALLPLLQVCSQTLTSVMEELMAINALGKYEKQVGALVMTEKKIRKLQKFKFVKL